MKKVWIIIFVSLVVIFIGIQFIRPAKNDRITNPQDDIVFHLQIPADVKKTIVNACYDCHSDRTHYPFYNRIAPASWLLARDIKQGKSHLNFSEWAKYDRKDQVKLLSNICDEITSGDMPLKAYRFMHSLAVLDPGQKDSICKWTDQAASELMSQKK